MAPFFMRGIVAKCRPDIVMIHLFWGRQPHHGAGMEIRGGGCGGGLVETRPDWRFRFRSKMITVCLGPAFHGMMTMIRLYNLIILSFVSLGIGTYFYGFCCAIPISHRISSSILQMPSNYPMTSVTIYLIYQVCPIHSRDGCAALR